jgi:hypothetical protein
LFHPNFFDNEENGTLREPGRIVKRRGTDLFLFGITRTDSAFLQDMGIEARRARAALKNL